MIPNKGEVEKYRSELEEGRKLFEKMYYSKEDEYYKNSEEFDKWVKNHPQYMDSVLKWWEYHK